jgi:RNA polymerase sigma factor (sigma-70 family)
MDWNEIYVRLTSDSNDRLAWEAVERRVEVWARAGLWMHGQHLIEDAVVDTCAGIALGLDHARGAETFAGFAYGHFLNARRRLRRSMATGTVTLDGIDVAAPQAAEELDAETLVRLKGALELLPRRERTAVVLRYFEELSAIQIAAHLGVTSGNARRILFNGLRRLRRQLREGGVGHGDLPALPREESRTGDLPALPIEGSRTVTAG